MAIRKSMNERGLNGRFWLPVTKSEFNGNEGPLLGGSSHPVQPNLVSEVAEAALTTKELQIGFATTSDSKEFIRMQVTSTVLSVE